MLYLRCFLSVIIKLWLYRRMPLFLDMLQYLGLKCHIITVKGDSRRKSMCVQIRDKVNVSMFISVSLLRYMVFTAFYLATLWLWNVQNKLEILKTVKKWNSYMAKELCKTNKKNIKCQHLNKQITEGEIQTKWCLTWIMK